MSEPVKISVTVNGRRYDREVEPRLLLVQFIREDLQLTGTHIGCDTTYCGACTILLNGVPVKSCTVLAVQADGGEVRTVEGLEQNGKLHPLQEAFSEHHGLQCGYCTPGMLMSALYLLEKKKQPTQEEIRKGIQGNVCRCTGYANIFTAIEAAAQKMRGSA
jgi:carbon-monoxide dehydrogenase small subunit